MSHSPAERAQPALEPLLDEALQWQMRLHAGQATAQERQEYADWKAADADHARAAAEAERLWQSLGHTGVQASPRAVSRRRMPLALAAVCTMMMVGALAWLTPSVRGDGEQTGVGQLQVLQLDDGSVLQLDAATEVSIDFTTQRRHVEVKRGQIHVQVAPDAARPFEVRAGASTTRALGTAFNVRREDDAVEVTVTEHAVQVRVPTQREAVTVNEGQRVAYGADGRLQQPETVDTQTLTAWRRGYLAFDGEPLASVVQRMSRYRRGFIFISDAALRDLPLTGVFPTTDTDVLLDALPGSLPVQVRRWPGVVIIQPAS